MTKVPTCFGAKGDTPASFKLPRDGPIKAVKLFHVNGYIKCKHGSGYFWGCKSGQMNIEIADSFRNGLFAKGRSFYTLPGYGLVSDHIVLNFKGFVEFNGKKNEELKIWITEDFYDASEYDNLGTHCVMVYLMYEYL